MKISILKFSVTVSLPLLLALFLIVSFSSCSKPNLGDIVREHIEAVNTDDVKKNLTFFADDAVYEIAVPKFSGKFSGKDQLRNQMEWDVVNNARLTINDMQGEGKTVIVELTEKNEGWRLLGIEQPPFMATYKFRGRQLEKVKLEFSPKTQTYWTKNLDPLPSGPARSILKNLTRWLRPVIQLKAPDCMSLLRRSGEIEYLQRG